MLKILLFFLEVINLYPNSRIDLSELISLNHRIIVAIFSFQMEARPSRNGKILRQHHIIGMCGIALRLFKHFVDYKADILRKKSGQKTKRVVYRGTHKPQKER